MAKQFTRTWWGNQFLEAIEKTTDSGRLSRGRSYARGNKVKSFTMELGDIQARVRGSINPYFGVTKEPLYKTSIQFDHISPAKWSAAIALIASKASLISRLLLKEIPENIEDNFKLLRLNLLPGSNDFKGQCSCPDSSNPCKHIAGVYHLIAAEIDRDPFLLFELRGLPKQKLLEELAKSPLGQALSNELSLKAQPPRLTDYYYAPLTKQKPSKNQDLKTFWQGSKRLPQTINAVTPNPVTGIAVKKQGDFPAFWQRDNSFIEAMEMVYEQVKKKGKI